MERKSIQAIDCIVAFYSYVEDISVKANKVKERNIELENLRTEQSKVKQVYLLK